MSHPNIHPKLQNFSIFYSFGPLIGTNERAIAFLEEIGLIPAKTSEPPKCCNLPMKVEEKKDAKLGWIWRCAEKGTKKKNSHSCRKSKNPSLGTFFDGTSCRIEVRDVLGIIICFVAKMKVTDVFRHLLAWRAHNELPEIGIATIVDYYSYCWEIVP